MVVLKRVKGDMGLESLKGIKWLYKVNNLDDERYPRLLDSEWEVKPCRSRQGKTWREESNNY